MLLTDPDTARASMGLTVSAFRNHGELIEDQYETYLKAAGFHDIYPYGYDQETGVDTIAAVIGHKKIDDFELIAVAVCGQGYGKEWGGNLEVGDEERHVGFDKAAKLLEEQIEGYIRTHGLEGNKKFWISGFSRAAAVSNLTAADMIESGQYEDVYAYLFGVPRTTKAPIPYPGIYNICGIFDPVPQIPMASWGYERYGTDLYTPAEETDSRYARFITYCSGVNIALGNPFFQNNPEVNFQIHMILELGITFRSSHKLRKTAISSLVNSGISLNTVRQFAGHVDERTTLRYYTYDRDSRAEKDEKFESALAFGNLEKTAEKPKKK